MDSGLFADNSPGLFPGAVVTGARDVPARDRSPLKHVLRGYYGSYLLAIARVAAP